MFETFAPQRPEGSPTVKIDTTGAAVETPLDAFTRVDRVPRARDVADSPHSRGTRVRRVAPVARSATYAAPARWRADLPGRYLSPSGPPSAIYSSLSMDLLIFRDDRDR